MKLEFTSIKGHKYEITIGTDTTPADSSVLRLSDDPLHLSWEKSEYIFDPIRTISATIRLKTCTDLSYLHTASPLGTKVTVTCGDDTVFFGYLTPQSWEAPADGVWDEVELVAVDALSALKDVPYTLAQTGKFQNLHAIDIIFRASTIAGLGFDPTTLLFNTANICEYSLMNKQLYQTSDSEGKSWTDILKGIAMITRQVYYIDGKVLKLGSIDDRIEDVEELSLAKVRKGCTKSIDEAVGTVVVEFDDTDMMNIQLNPTEESTSDFPTLRVKSKYYQSTSAAFYDDKIWDGMVLDGVKTHPVLFFRSNRSGKISANDFMMIGPAKTRVALPPTMGLWAYIEGEVRPTYTLETSDSYSYDNGYLDFITVSNLSNEITRGDTNLVQDACIIRIVSAVDGSTLKEFHFSDDDKYGENFIVFPNEDTQNTRRDTLRAFKSNVPYYIEVDPTILYKTLSVSYGNDQDTFKDEFGKSIIKKSIKYVLNADLRTSVTVPSMFRNLDLTERDGMHTYTDLWSFADVHSNVVCPPIVPQQFAKPRTRFSLTAEPESVISIKPSMVFTDDSLSTKVLIVDAADIDLNDDTVQLSLVETYANADGTKEEGEYGLPVPSQEDDDEVTTQSIQNASVDLYMSGGSIEGISNLRKHYGGDSTIENTDANRQDWPKPVVVDGVSYYNLVPGTRSIGGKTVNVTGQVRMLKMTGTDNFRDLGGWPSTLGMAVKYGKIIRGSELLTSKDIRQESDGYYYVYNNGVKETNGYNYYTNHNATAEDQQTLISASVTAELDLRGVDQAAIEAANPSFAYSPFKTNSNISYNLVAVSIYSTPEQYVSSSSTNINNWKVCLDHIMSNIQRGATYIHCTWGADRTGELCMLLLGLLGVSQSDIAKDYELTTFGNKAKGAANKVDGSGNITELSPVNKVYTAVQMMGETTAQRNYFRWWNSIAGVPASTLKSFIDQMLGIDYDISWVPDSTSSDTKVATVGSTFHAGTLKDTRDGYIPLYKDNTYISTALKEYSSENWAHLQKIDVSACNNMTINFSDGTYYSIIGNCYDANGVFLKENSACLYYKSKDSGTNSISLKIPKTGDTYKNGEGKTTTISTNTAYIMFNVYKGKVAENRSAAYNAWNVVFS